MKRYRNNLVIRLFTYTEPSVDSLRESMLMGSIEANVGSEKKARALQDRFVSRMLAHGFAKSFVDRVAFTSVGKRPRERVVSLAKGDLYGHVYYTYDSAHVRWRVRAAVQHPLIRSWGDPYTSRWKSWLLFDRMTLPDSLVRELESARIAGMFPPGVWSGVKDIPRTGSDRFSIADFIAFYRKFSPAAVAPEHRPAALLLKNYLARYLFVYGIPKLPGSNRIDVKGITPHRINENDLYLSVWISSSPNQAAEPSTERTTCSISRGNIRTPTGVSSLQRGFPHGYETAYERYPRLRVGECRNRRKEFHRSPP